MKLEYLLTWATILLYDSDEMRVASTKTYNNRARGILTREFLEREYIANGRSAGNIAKELGVHQAVVINQSRFLGFQVRPNSSYNTSGNFGIYSVLKYQNTLTLDFLQREYVEKERSANDIGSQLNIGPDVVLQYLKRYGFEVRGKQFYLQGQRNARYGQPLSIGTREKISMANKGKLPWCTGNQLSKETCVLISEHHADFRLEKHPRWQGGKSFEPYTVEFNRQLKELIRMRDNYTCQICGVPEAECFEKLHCHHIDYDKENCLPTNLISLCRSCHTKTNSNHEYWIEYFTEKLLYKEER